MKNALIILIVFIYSFDGFSQQLNIGGYGPLSDSLIHVLKNQNVYNEQFTEEGVMCPEIDKDGEYECFGDSMTKVIGTIKNGKLNGPYTAYHKNGNIYISTTMVNDTYHGITKYYFSNGKLNAICEFKDGKLWNVNQMYDNSGRKLNSGDFSDGNGKLKLYYANGKLFRESLMQGGLANGPTEYYYKNGALMIKGTFRAGKIINTWTEYSTNGTIYLERIFK